jgi:hypothetical protein
VIADIEAEEIAFSAKLLDLFLGDFGLFVIAAIGEPDVAAGTSEADGGGPTDAAAAADDEGYV